MDIIDYIYDECRRQEAENLGDFANALRWMTMHRKQPILNPLQVGNAVMGIASLVEPEVNSWRPQGSPRQDNLRTSHVGFKYGGTAAPAGEVHERFHRWCETYMTVVIKFPAEEEAVRTAEMNTLVKQLLQIHPWADGNGRTASILLNLLLKTLDDPTPLPDYFDQEN